MTQHGELNYFTISMLHALISAVILSTTSTIIFTAFVIFYALIRNVKITCMVEFEIGMHPKILGYTVWMKFIYLNWTKWLIPWWMDEMRTEHFSLIKLFDIHMDIIHGKFSLIPKMGMKAWESPKKIIMLPDPLPDRTTNQPPTMKILSQTMDA